VSNIVLDASAAVALLNDESGAARVAAAVAQGAAIAAVNLAEAVTRFNHAGQSEAAIRAHIEPLDLEVIDFDDDLSYRTGMLRPATRAAGHSLGDRACLALADRLGLPALTTDRPWTTVPVGVTVEVIR
jgi:PIN domain nuclease of toxin-antitoxin system